MKIIFKKKVFLSWLWVVFCSITIFLIVPAGNTMQRFVSQKWGREVFIYFVLVVFAIAFVCLINFLIFKLKIRSPSRYVWLFVVTGTYIYFTLKLWDSPVETVHFLEYGLLGFFLFRALSHNVRDKSVYFTATLIVLLVGTFDEVLQWITPQRYWNYHDVWLNTLSGGLFQLAVWKIIKPKIISERANAKSIRILTSIFGVCLIILGLCASNTPKRVAYYTELMPGISFLQREEPMSEFGYQHNDPEIGVFYSRLSPKDLRKKDKVSGEQYAQILNSSVNEDYDQFLREYTPITDPFMHELRVHIFRRDKHFDKAKAASKLNEKKESYFIAYKENLILQKYFTQSIEKSVYSWNEDKIKESEVLIDKSKSYESPVSAGLFTGFSEKRMRITILILILGLILINFIWQYKEKHKFS